MSITRILNPFHISAILNMHCEYGVELLHEEEENVEMYKLFEE